MLEPIVIVHGWSDTSSSFKNLANFLQSQLGTTVKSIDLADWISMNDDVTYADLAEAMNIAWISHELTTITREVNVIVHSTGALVVREWMTRYFKANSVPIKRLLMLAPANFGSELAHKGRSFIGRALKGWGNDGFETGKAILKGLELASPYSWDLAHKDLFGDETWYGSGKILATVLVGNEGYHGVRSIANEIGSDGTVRISTANLNAIKVRLELDEEQKPLRYSYLLSRGKVAFGILDKINHSSIILSEDDNLISDNTLKRIILRSLQVSDNDYGEEETSFHWQEEISSTLGENFKKSSRMQNMVTKASDNLGNKIDDYFVEFYRTSNSDEKFEHEIYSKFINTVHAYCDDNSYRSLYLSIDELERINETRGMRIDNLFVSISAQPAYDEMNSKKQPVGYLQIEPRSSGGLTLNNIDIQTFFKPHMTILIDVVLTRKLRGEVFKLTKF